VTKLKKVEFEIDWYLNLINNSNEKDVLISKIKELVGENKDSCLEIGLGVSPYFAKMLCDKFENYDIVERRKVNAPMPGGIKLIEADWETFENNKKYDVIIASHVIYYFKNKKKAIEKIFDYLKDDGAVYFVVNGKSADYGPLKLAFSKLVGEDYTFTYDELLKILNGRRIREYTIPSVISFKDYEDLFEILKISFDAYPEDYQRLKKEVINYLKDNVRNKFTVDQKIIEVKK